jgi:hypothetical protein
MLGENERFSRTAYAQDHGFQNHEIKFANTCRLLSDIKCFSIHQNSFPHCREN